MSDFVVIIYPVVDFSHPMISTGDRWQTPWPQAQPRPGSKWHIPSGLDGATLPSQHYTLVADLTTGMTQFYTRNPVRTADEVHIRLGMHC